MGEFLLNFYFSQAESSSSYGPAGILIILWINYTCLCLFHVPSLPRYLQNIKAFCLSSCHMAGGKPAMKKVEVTEKVIDE